MASALRGLSDTFAFHASSESFLDSHLERPPGQNGLDGNLSANRLLLTRLLNRNVAIVSSHRDMLAVMGLDEREGTDQNVNPAPYCATDAYASFMAPFFPRPNLLLSDGQAHSRMRHVWQQRMHRMVQAQTQGLVRNMVTEHFVELAGSQIDLYESMKKLAWKLLLGLFLGLKVDDPVFAELQRLQEDVLHGQFSLFPVSVHIGLWQSPRKTGIDAKAKLQKLLSDRLKESAQSGAGCPFVAAGIRSTQTEEELAEMANHMLLFTSSLTAKALAALTTPLLNIFAFARGGERLCHKLDQLPVADRRPMLRSIQLETERLSPPIAGIMRRVMSDQLIPGSADEDAPTIHLQKGSDVWLYFVRGGRDKSVFGGGALLFNPERFVNGTDPGPQPLAFSAGPKACLGRELVRDVCLALGETMLDLGLRLDAQVEAKGVRAWLGWTEDATAEDWARDMRQLPVQHPREPVMVQVTVVEPGLRSGS